MFLHFRYLDLNTCHNYFTSLRFCFQGCLQRHLDFGAADKDHLYFLFRFHHYAFDDLTDELIVIFHRMVLQSVKYGENFIESGFCAFSLLPHGYILFELYGQSLLFIHKLGDAFLIYTVCIVGRYRLEHFLKLGGDFGNAYLNLSHF